MDRMENNYIAILQVVITTKWWDDYLTYIIRKNKLKNPLVVIGRKASIAAAHFANTDMRLEVSRCNDKYVELLSMYQYFGLIFGALINFTSTLRMCGTET